MWIFKIGKFKYINIWHVLSQKKKKKIGRLLKKLEKNWQVVEIVEGKKKKKNW